MTHSLGQGRKGEGPVHSWGARGGHGEGRYQIHPWLADSSEQQEVCSPELVTAARSNDPVVTTAPWKERKHPLLSEKGEKQKEAQQH